VTAELSEVLLPTSMALIVADAFENVTVVAAVMAVETRVGGVPSAV